MESREYEFDTVVEGGITSASYLQDKLAAERSRIPIRFTVKEDAHDDDGRRYVSVEVTCSKDGVTWTEFLAEIKRIGESLKPPFTII